MNPSKSAFSRRRFPILAGAVFLLIAAAEAPGAEAVLARLTADEIVQRMMEMNEWRSAALRKYSAHRRYVAENKRLGKRAEVEVRENYAYPGIKSFEVLSEEGNGFIRRKVIDKLIEAEVNSTADEERDRGRISPENYAFTLLGEDQAEGRDCYLLQAEPHEDQKYLFRGKVWIDKQDFAVVRIEGAPAKKPSFWVREADFVRRYVKLGPFWLTAELESTSKLLIVGKSTLHIQYGEYRINGSETPVAARSQTAEPGLTMTARMDGGSR